MSRQHLYRLLFIMINHESLLQCVKEYWIVLEVIFSVQYCVEFASFDRVYPPKLMHQLSMEFYLNTVECKSNLVFKIIFFYSEKIWLPLHFTLRYFTLFLQRWTRFLLGFSTQTCGELRGQICVCIFLFCLFFLCKVRSAHLEAISSLADLWSFAGMTPGSSYYLKRQILSSVKPKALNYKCNVM